MAIVLVASWMVGCGVTNNDSDPPDDDDGDGGADGGGDADSDADADVSIPDIQQGNVPDGQLVGLEGVVVTSPIMIKESGGTLFVEEPEGGQWSGIQVYIYADVLLALDPLPVRGDEVNITGQYTEHYDISQVVVASAADLEILGPTDEPTAEVVDPSDVNTDGELSEAYESVLIKVEDVEVLDGDTGYGQWEVTDNLLIDDYFFESGGGPSGENIDHPTGATFEGISGILMYSFDEWKLAPRDTDDYEGGGDADADSDADADATIYEIQQGDFDEGDWVNVSGAVVTTPVHENSQGLFIQDPAGGPYSGIYIYLYSEVLAATDLQPGDVVDLRGEYIEFDGLSELRVTDVADIEVVDTASVPAPAVVLPADIATDGSDAEQYEGVLVQVEDVTVTAEADSYGQFTVTGGLLIDDWMFSSAGGPSGELMTITNGMTFQSITGPLTFNFDDYKMVPRTNADLVE